MAWSGNTCDMEKNGDLPDPTVTTLSGCVSNVRPPARRQGDGIEGVNSVRFIGS